MHILIICVLIGLILFSAFFAASEIGMMSLNRYRLRHLVKQNNKQAIRVNRLLARPEILLSVVLIGNTLANILASSLATLLGQSLYGDWGVVITTAILTILILVFAEMAPKTLGAVYAQSIAFRSAWLLLVFQKLFMPLIWLITSVSNYSLALFGVSTKSIPKEVLSGEELRTVVLEAGGLLHVEHKSMLVRLLDLEKATVEDVMIPKSELLGLDVEEPWHTVLAQLKTAQHTRLPLYQGSIEQLVGVIHVRDALHLCVDQMLTLDHLLAIAEMPYYVPETTSLHTQIVHFRKLKKRSAFVVDEYGEIQGLVTLEDILEEIIGEFTTTASSLSRDLVLQADGSYLVDASLTLRELYRALHWEFPLIGPKTLSGLIIETLGFIPPADCCLKIESYYIEVLKVHDNMVRTVRIWRDAEEDYNAKR